MNSDDTTRDFDPAVGLAEPYVSGDTMAPSDPGLEEFADQANLDLLLDVDLQVSVELGRASLKFRDVLNLAAGSVVELGRQTSEPVDILVNGSLLATGEVVVVDDRFAVRITKLLNKAERLKKVL